MHTYKVSELLSEFWSESVLTLGLKRDMKDDLEACFFSSWAGGGGSGFAAASRVLALEGSTFFCQNNTEEKYKSWDIHEPMGVAINVADRVKARTATCDKKEEEFETGKNGQRKEQVPDGREKPSYDKNRRWCFL